MIVKKTCEHCSKHFYCQENKVRHLAKAHPEWRTGRFCSNACAGMDRRSTLTKAEKIERKRLYDIEYRRRKGQPLLDARKAYYYANRERIKAEMKEYRSTPEYKKRMRQYLSTYWDKEKKDQKSDYDRKRRCNLKWNNPDLAEAEYYLLGIEDQVFAKMGKYERLWARGYYKRQIERVRNAKVKRGYA